ncbi:hypothetical protein FTUN_6214 [Frigoriglobus tundricola]|uniref:Uncharacterized protein n=1 Tax=Frigoriglobus tundricola TaxID=2774151 RepID=A0A6M5YX97_9BACT|nr:hypothetical protein FTUN_6214 [Frigoriglobus tundricola]
MGGWSGCGASSLHSPSSFMAHPSAATRAEWDEPSPVRSASIRSRSTTQSAVSSVRLRRAAWAASMALRISGSCNSRCV